VHVLTVMGEEAPFAKHMTLKRDKEREDSEGGEHQRSSVILSLSTSPLRDRDKGKEKDEIQLKSNSSRSSTPRNLRSSTPRSLRPPTPTPSPIPSIDVATKENNNEKEREVISPRVRNKTLTKKDKDKDKEEDIIRLTKMSEVEREMIKGFVKLTRKKNKILERIEEVNKKEKEALMMQWELEKRVLEKQISSLQSQVTLKNHEVLQEASKNQDLRNQLQQTHLELHATQASLVTLKQSLKRFKKQCDLELNKKSKSILEMTLQLGKLHKLRDSMDCVICEEKVAKVILEPCCHMVMCRNCSNNVRKCPMCRADINSRLEVFYNWIV